MSPRKIVAAEKTIGRHTYNNAWLLGRQKGYEDGVKAERDLVLRALEVEAKEWQNLGMKDEAHSIRMLEKLIKKGLHATPRGKK